MAVTSHVQHLVFIFLLLVLHNFFAPQMITSGVNSPILVPFKSVIATNFRVQCEKALMLIYADAVQHRGIGTAMQRQPKELLKTENMATEQLFIYLF